jgi:hypothetical protein
MEVAWRRALRRQRADEGSKNRGAGLRFCSLVSLHLHNMSSQSHNHRMTEKEIVLETIRALPDNCSLDDIAERIEFMAAVRKGLDQLDMGEGIPHEEVKKQLASWLIS